MSSQETAISGAVAEESAPEAPELAFTFDPSLSQFNVPSRAYRDSHPGIEAIASGALVFHTDQTAAAPLGAPSASQPQREQGQDRILLLQRAAHDSMPLRWESPGGAVDNEDPTVLYGMARELWEEAGLRAVRVVAMVGEGFFFFTRRGVRVCKFSFEVEVEQDESGGEDGGGVAAIASPPVTLSHEHAAAMWVTEAECLAKKVGDFDFSFTYPNQEQVVLEGLRARRERLEKAQQA